MTSPQLTHDDRHQISEVLVRYATGIDTLDRALLRSCFTDDCELDYGEVGTWHGAEAVADWMIQTHEPLGPTLHRVTNHTITEADGGAQARSYVDALIIGPDESVVRAEGLYEDELVRDGGAWKIVRRRYTMVHLDARPGPGAPA